MLKCFETPNIFRSSFTKYGQIVNISMEIEKNCGFITYERVESAERSIAELNGSSINGIQLKVSLARLEFIPCCDITITLIMTFSQPRRQPVIDPINDASSSSTWSTIAASHSQKGSHKDKREMVTYDEDIF